MGKTDEDGQKVMRVAFNPSGSHAVQKVKEDTAELHNYLNAVKAEGYNEELLRRAQEYYEIGAMLAVKALTGPKS